MRDAFSVAYLTSAYARASDSFIRLEVEKLRELGHEVHTFSIRRPAESEIVSHEIHRERNATDYILDSGFAKRGVVCVARMARQAPVKAAKAAMLALRCSPPGTKAKLWALAYFVEACILACRLKKCDVRHLHNHIGEGSATVAMLAGLMLDLPYSLTIHGPGEFDHPIALSLDEKIGRAAFVISVSEWGRSQLMRWSAPADWQKIKIAHCGISDQFVDVPPPLVDTSRRQLVFVGRLDLVKGLFPLISAVRSLRDQGLQFKVLVIGDGPLRSEVEAMVERLGIQDSVEMCGWMSSSNVREAILQSHALVLPSFAENLPVAIMEALALARPVISTYIGGIPELVRDQQNGWLVPASSVVSLAAAMREALTAPIEHLQQMGVFGRTLVLENHSAIREATKISALIQGVLPAGDPHTLHTRTGDAAVSCRTER